MAGRYLDRDRYGRQERTRSGYTDEAAAHRRRLDERERGRWQADEPQRHHDDEERWHGSAWGNERSYSSGRDYGDGEYGWRGEPREYGGRPMTDRDYGWRAEPPAPPFTRTRHAADDRPVNDAGDVDFARQGYGGPYGRERYGAREWSSSEGWRVPGPYAGRGPRGYQRTDQRIEEDLHERLTAHGLIDATDVECRVASGEVTLTGFVNSREARRAAEDLAEDTYGVRQVNNQLRVRSHAGDEGVGRTSVLGLTESQVQNRHSPADSPTGPERPRTRS